MPPQFQKPVNAIISGISRLLSISTRYPWFSIITIAVITVGFGIAANQLTVNNDYDTWLPENDPITILYKEINETFSAAAVVLVALDLEDVFTEGGISQIQKATEILEGIPGIYSVMSLTNVIDIRDEEGTVVVARLGDRLEPTPEGLREFRDYVLSREHYSGIFVSRDGRYANIIVNVRDEADEVEVSKVIKETLEKEWEKENIYLGGDPVYTVYIDQYMEEDFTRTGPIALGLIFIVLFVSFRSGWGILLPLSLSVIAIIWTMGIKAIIGWPANVMTPSVAILLFAMGSDYSVHVLKRFHSRESGTEPSLEIAPPVIMSALTTIVGLLTFATTDIPIIKWFGAEMAIGLGVCMFLALTLLPAVMHSFGSRLARKWQAPKDRPDRFSAVVSRLGRWGIRYRFLILGFLVAALAAAGLGITRIKTTSNYLEMLPEESLPRKASYLFRDHFVGSYAQTLYVKGAVDNPAVLKTMIRVENYHRSIPEFSGYSSIADLIAEENYIMNGSYSIPDTKEGVASLWLLLEGDPTLRNLVTSDRSQGIVNAYTSLEEGEDMEKVSDAVDLFLEKETNSELTTVNRRKLSESLDEKIQELKIREVAEEIAWLAMYYSDHSVGEGLEGKIEQYLQKIISVPLTAQDIEELADRAGRYAEEELFLDDPETISEVRSAAIRVLELEQGKDIWSENILPELNALITRVPADEKDAVIPDLAAWVEAEVHRQKIERTAGGMTDLLPDNLGPHFWKRTHGVLAELYSPTPSFFSKKIDYLSLPEEAVESRTPIYIKQMGVPTFFAILDRLLHRSQIQSLSIASALVFLMIWLGLQIVRGAAFALISVLASITLILGFMGVTGVPLDFGTVLTGGLIIGLGVDGVIHLIYHFRRSKLKPEEITRTVSEVGKAITTASCTTAAGLFSLAASKITALVNFGLINGMAIMIVTILNLILVPLLIVIFPVSEE
ncbi:MAG: MMPL family transporter [Deltaproteobacteria bacterium]|nr:MAG: MMPL family transporter [Deltaproteobacteria bacterium]